MDFKRFDRNSNRNDSLGDLSMAITEDQIKHFDEIVGEEIKGNPTIKALITNSKGKFKTFKVNDVEVKILYSIPRTLRHEIESYQGKDQIPIGETESIVYSLIAKMCIEDPFNKPETWEYIDNETGMALNILSDIFAEVSKTENQIKSFR